MLDVVRVANLKVMKIERWIEKMKEERNGDWLLRTPRHTQGCRAKRKEVPVIVRRKTFIRVNV
jgi:hypothetical protein